MIENPLPDKTLSNAIAATDISKGMNSNEAFLIAQQRGYKGKIESFRSRFEKQDLGEAFGLRRVPHKSGKENWLYFDAKS